MKVLLAADIFPPETGGPATYVVTLANELVKAGDEVKIVSLNPNSDRATVSCFMCHVSWRNKVLRYLQYLWLIYRHAKQIDVIYAMGPVNAGLPALIAARLRSKKFVVKVVGDYAWEQGVQRFGVKADITSFQKSPGGSLLARLLVWIEQSVARQADIVIVPSDYLAALVEGWGARAERVRRIYNGVSIQPEQFDRSLKPAGERWVVTVSRLVPWKGMMAVIEMMVELVKTYPNLKLIIVGEGPERGRLAARMETLGLSERVQFVGAVFRRKAIEYMASADVVVLNSGYEGLSHILLEALAVGVPVCASDAGGNREILAAYPSLLFPYNNLQAMQTVVERQLTNPTTVDRESLVRTFSVDEMEKQTITLLKKICAN